MANYNSFKKVTGEAIVDDTLSAADIGDGQVTSAKINNSAVDQTKIDAGAVDGSKLAATLDISGKTVTYRPLVDGDFATGAVAGTQLESGATIANLGYTPVNAAGDTVTGQIVIQNNTTIASTGDTDSGVHINGTSVSIRRNGADQISFNSNGQVNESANARPAWQASGRGGWRYGNQYDGANNWRELDNIGWNFSTQGGVTTSNNCRVTVPTAGYYYCYLQSYWYNNSNSTNGYTHWKIGLNGGNGELYGGRTNHQMYAYGLRNNYAPGIMTSFVRFMNASQYVTPRPYFGGNQGRHHGNHSYWCGYLVG
jgi:hypothetical protein